MQNWNDYKKELLKDPKVAKEYKKLEPQYKLISELIRIRIKKGLTQEALAKKIGTKQSAIARIESGNGNPSLMFLEKIAKATDSKLEIVMR